MQLDPNQSLSNQLRQVPGERLEGLTAAACASIGFTVFRGLFLKLGGERIAETDVFATIFTPLRESRIMVECKGGHPTFNDIRKFASLNALLSPPPDELLIICKQGCPQNRIDLATLLRVRIVERTNLTYYLLPLVGGHTVRQQRATTLNRYLAWQTVHEYLLSQIGTHSQLQAHNRFLISELWAIGDAQNQVERSEEAYSNDFPNTTNVVAQFRGTSASNALYEAVDDVVEAAMYIELQHRIMNAYAIVRRTLQLIQHFSPQHLVASTGMNLRSAIVTLSAYPRYLVGFPSFLQTFLFVWGGFLYLPYRDREINQMASETSTTTEAIELYLRVLNQIFTGSGAAMFYQHRDFYFFKYVPAAFRALGAIHRQKLDPLAYGGIQFFYQLESPYRVALERALTRIGGIVGLRY